MLKWVFFVTFTFIAAVSVYLFFYLGGYKKVTLTETHYQTLNLVFKKHLGPYHKINLVIKAVEELAGPVGYKCQKTFGEYLDDPAKVDKSRLRAIGGCIVDQQVTELPEGVHFKKVKARPVLKAEFRGAPSIGPFKVYPKAMDYIASHGLKMAGPTLEIYQMLPGDEFLTEFLFPLQKGSPSVNQETENQR